MLYEKLDREQNRWVRDLRRGNRIQFNEISIHWGLSLIKDILSGDPLPDPINPQRIIDSHVLEDTRYDNGNLNTIRNSVEQTIIIETGGNDVTYADLTYLLGQGVTDHQELADACNADFRHITTMTVDGMFKIIYETLEMITQDVGTPTYTGQWVGIFNDYIQSLPDNTRGSELKRGYNRMIQKGDGSTHIVDPTESFPVGDPQVKQRKQREGYILKEFDEVCQELCQDPTYDDNSDFKDRPDLIHAMWLGATGGRRFGIVTNDDIADVLNEKDKDDALETVFSTNRDGNNAAETTRNDPASTPQDILDAGNAWN